MKKKIIILLICILCIPINIFAYSDYIYPGGDNIGINMNIKGVLIIGFYEVDGKYNYNNLSIGSYITKVDGHEVNTVSDLVSSINKYQSNNKVNLTIYNNGKYNDIEFKLQYVDGKYKTGLYVKDSILGIGTLSYIDPLTGIYGALGHEIIESNTKEKILLDDGAILESKVTSIDKSRNGSPGTKNATITDNTLGDIDKNTNVGIYGNYTDDVNKELVKVGKPEELKLGKAYIYTTLTDNTIDKYEINITKIDKKNTTKNIYFEITDERLLSNTGGIVQGMSGSPILQDDKIFGAVTHVVIEKVNYGYGVFITTMLEEGEK